jgi:hypothetical protein
LLRNHGSGVTWIERPCDLRRQAAAGRLALIETVTYRSSSARIPLRRKALRLSSFPMADVVPASAIGKIFEADL